VLSVTVQHTVEPVDLCLDRLCKIIGIHHIGSLTLQAYRLQWRIISLGTWHIIREHKRVKQYEGYLLVC